MVQFFNNKGNFIMDTLTAKHFSAVDYMQKLRSANFTQQQAETLAQETEFLIEKVIEQTKTSIEDKDLATKKDVLLIQAEIRETELKLQNNLKSLELKIMTLYGAGFLVMLGILAKGFHWF